jgi:hypothetical protein
MIYTAHSLLKLYRAAVSRAGATLVTPGRRRGRIPPDSSIDIPHLRGWYSRSHRSLFRRAPSLPPSSLFGGSSGKGLLPSAVAAGIRVANAMKLRECLAMGKLFVSATTPELDRFRRVCQDRAIEKGRSLPRTFCHAHIRARGGAIGLSPGPGPRWLTARERSYSTMPIH